jgi:hypothetical protein
MARPGDDDCDQPMGSCVSPHSDTEPTVLITFDSAKYILNVGENTTRAFLQSRRNWKKTRGVFLTYVGTQRASGLPGKCNPDYVQVCR